ncbi:MAG: hypothetical protein RML36_11290 [Anaerolineae bacterium]|nr:hypothetical protein [Anaerolineae bacterium]MDW8100050.1 hypothetical protein [Anaerolineae bacterium]
MPVTSAPVRLRAQMVDVTLEADQPEALARVSIRLLLDPAVDKAQTMEVQIVGSVSDEIPQESVQLWSDGQPLAVTGASSSLRAQVSLSPGQRLELRLAYVQRLGGDPLIAFAYPMAMATAWPTRDGSSRVRLALPPGVPREAWLMAEPLPTDFDGVAVTWHFDQAAPDLLVQFRFLRPDVWRQIADPASELEDAEGRLARLDMLLAIAATDVPAGPAFTRFYPIALAHALEMIQQMPDRPEPHLALAHLYSLHQDGDGALSLDYAPLVAAEARLAAALGAPIERVRPLLGQALSRLVVRARREGDWSEALSHLDEVAKLGLDPVGLALERNELLINLARAYLWDGRWAEAARLVGIDRALRPPWLGAAIIQVETGWRTRTITLQMYAAPGQEEEAAAQVRRTVEALHSADGAQVSASLTEERAELRLTLAMSDAVNFLERGRRLARALPADPEWALLAALLRPEAFHWERSEDWLRWRISYAETIDLRLPVDAWQARASQIEQETGRIAVKHPELTAELVRELGQASAAAWRGLSRNVQVHYTLHLFPFYVAGEPQRWLLEMDERRQLTATYQGILPWLARWIR